MNIYLLAADAMVVVHATYVTAVVLGLVLILVGRVRGWRWVGNFWLRAAHLLMIGVVAAESLGGIVCPLTRWENELRALGGAEGRAGSFVGRLVHDLLFFSNVPEWVFTVVYCLFGLTVLAAWFWAPPRWPRRRAGDCPEPRNPGADAPGSAALAAKRDRLLDLLRSYGSCAVAFSGGLDSTVLAKAAQLALGDRAVAVTGASASLAAGELDESIELARQIGIRHEVARTEELAVPGYQENTSQRCYFCKTELFLKVEELAARLGVAVVCDGSNRDDQSEHRPGIQAARQRQVRSPLAECGLGKAELRALAVAWGIPIWDKPATPCLSSRIAYGEQVTPERLAMIDRAERFLRERGLRPLRVRYHKGDMARIEVPTDALPQLIEPEFRRALVEHLKSLGFKYVALDLEGFRSGSMNAVLAADSLRIAKK